MDEVSITGEAMSDIYIKGYVLFSVVVVVVVCLFVCFVHVRSSPRTLVATVLGSKHLNEGVG